MQRPQRAIGLKLQCLGISRKSELGNNSYATMHDTKVLSLENASQNFRDAEALPILFLIRPFSTTTSIFASQHSPRCKPATLDGVSTMYLCHVWKSLLKDRFMLRMHAPAEQVLLTIPKNE
jgi:hypothetical protein